MSRFLFVVTPRSLASTLASVTSALAARGHAVRIVSEGDDGCPAARSDDWRDSILALRGFRDYSRYLHAPLDRCERLRKRALLATIDAVSAGEMAHISAPCPSCGREIKNDELAGGMFGIGADGVAHVEALFSMAEGAVPSDPAYEAFLRAERPDAVIVAPLVRFGSGEADIVKSARALGIPTALAVPALDTLTAHGLIHVHPDRVFVWNEAQRDEAVSLHGVAPDRVTITGAARFDAFGALEPAHSRDAFCGEHGLDPRQMIVTYLCSSDFVHRDEAAFFAQWIAALRSDERLHRCGVVIRPHPRAMRTWKAVDRRQWERVAFIKARGGEPAPTLHASLDHAAAAVALNTTAAVEAAILGKPVFTLVTDETAPGQTGTLSFNSLLREHGGFVERADDVATHLRQLGDALDAARDPAPIRSFAARFVGMGDSGRPAGERLAGEIARLAKQL